MGVKRNWLLVITKIIIDIALCFVIIGSITTLYTFIKQAQNPYHHHLSIPVHFKGATLERYYPTHQVKDGEITMQAHYGSAMVDTTNPFAEMPMILAYAVNQLLVIAILYNLRKIFLTFYHSEPFDYKNITRIKIIAFYLSLIWVKNIIYSLIMHSYFIDYQLASKFLWRWDFNIRGIVIAAIVYIVAEVFKYGFELKKENEEFV